MAAWSVAAAVLGRRGNSERRKNFMREILILRSEILLGETEVVGACLTVSSKGAKAPYCPLVLMSLPILSIAVDRCINASS